MIVFGAWGIHEDPTDRADRIAEAEDRAEQAAFDAMRERA